MACLRCLPARPPARSLASQIYETGRQGGDLAANATTPAGAAPAVQRTDVGGPQQPQQAQQGAAAGASSQPAVDCTTPCEDYNGVQICTTAAGELRQCTPGSGNSGSSIAGQVGTTSIQVNAPSPNTTSTAATAPPAAEPSSSSGSMQAAAQLAGQPLCSKAALPGGRLLRRLRWAIQAHSHSPTLLSIIYTNPRCLLLLHPYRCRHYHGPDLCRRLHLRSALPPAAGGQLWGAAGGGRHWGVRLCSKGEAG